jgi:hypothetical protein
MAADELGSAFDGPARVLLDAEARDIEQTFV